MGYRITRLPGVIDNKSGGGKRFDYVLFVSTTAPDADYPTIAAAITGASAGDIILLDAETFTENITINIAITLMALSPQETTITTAAGDTITITDDNVVLRGLTIDNTRASGTIACIKSGNDGLIIENCIVTKTSGGGASSRGIHNTGGANWILTDVDVTVNSGTLKYAYLADTAASSAKLVRGSYTGVTEDILLNHASADLELDNTDIAGEISTTAADVISGKVHDLILVKNSSGFPSDKGEVGYLDEAGEFQFTTTLQLNATWCIVEIGNSDGYNMWVRRRGDTNVNYTTAVVVAPVKGDFLVTSASLTLAQAQTTMHPAIFAVCTANGAGGTVAVQLLTGTEFKPLTFSDDLLRPGLAVDDSVFTGTIATLPGGAVLTYNVVTGDENGLDAASTSHLAKLRLYNSTRSTYALISDTVVGTNTITLTANVPGDWQVGDSLTGQSQVNTGTTGGAIFYDFEITSSAVPELTRALSLFLVIQDSGAGGAQLQFHPWETYGVSKSVSEVSPAAAVASVGVVSVSLISSRFTVLWIATGVNTLTSVITRLIGVWVAVP